jgi:putative nucleotidyltransferase with HDIG domain
MFFAERRRRSVSRLEFLKLRPGGTLETGERPTFWTGVWPKLLAVFGAALVSTWILSVGGPPFPYRAGQRAAREIRLTETLHIENASKTRNAREQKARETPPVFLNDPRPIETLFEALDGLADATAAAADVADLDPAIVQEWSLTAESFAQLKGAIPDAAAAAVFKVNIRDALVNLRRFGLIDRAGLPPDSERDVRTVEVRSISGDAASFYPTRDEILIDVATRDDGAIAKWLRSRFPGKESVALLKLIAGRLRPTLTYDARATEEKLQEAASKVPPVFDTYPAGLLVVEAGDFVDADKLRILEQEYQAIHAREGWTTWGFHRRWLGLTSLNLAVVAILATFVASAAPRRAAELRHVVALCGVFVVALALARLFGVEPYRAQIVPLACASFFLAVAYDRQLAAVFGVGLALLFAVTQPNPFEQFVVLAAGTCAGVLLLDSVRSRTKLIFVGLAAGAAYAAAQFAVGMLFEQTMSLAAVDALRSFAGGLIAGFVMSGSLPFVESLFGIATEISLIELADTSHPLLQDLIRKAPGTYNHSVTVSIIGEAAAKTIGANALVVRVGALFHDVGKMLKPQYFIENKGPDAVNRHEQLAPAISTLIIIGHVKDGVDLGRGAHLPQAILDMIEQHHGTTLVDYFFHEAARALQSRTDADEEIDESAFRYPGPKPQTKEAAVMMLADCVESASRALSDPTPARIDKLVHNLTLNRLLDGQFDECGITLQEIRSVEESLKKSLTAVYHGRIKYPAAV